MAKHRSHSIEFKRQAAQEFLAGETAAPSASAAALYGAELHRDANPPLFAPRALTGRPRLQILKFRLKLARIQEDPSDRVVEDHEPGLIVGLDCGHDLPELQDQVRPH